MMASDEMSDEVIKEMSGGKKWTHLLFEALMQEDMVAHIAKEFALAEITQLNTLEMYCTSKFFLYCCDKLSLMTVD
jgi:trans-2-enoyl-CoA reductase